MNSAELLNVQSEEGCLTDSGKVNTLTFSSVTLSVLPPLLAGIYFSGGEGFVGALSISGSYGTPILYGIIPVLLALNQRGILMKEQDNNTITTVPKEIGNMEQIAPGGMVSLGVLGAASIALISNHLISDVSSLLQSSSIV